MQFGKWLLLCTVPIIVVMIVVRETTTSRTLKTLFKSVGNPSRWLMLLATGRLDGRSADQNLESGRHDGQDVEDEAKASRLARSIIHKAKCVLWLSNSSVSRRICIAAYQISSSTQWVLPQLRFPDLFQVVLRSASVVLLDFVELGSAQCVRLAVVSMTLAQLAHINYFYKTVLITVRFRSLPVDLRRSCCLGPWGLLSSQSIAHSSKSLGGDTP